jgi:hypothetical protein
MFAAPAHAASDSDTTALMQQRIALADHVDQMTAARAKLERIARAEVG